MAIGLQITSQYKYSKENKELYNRNSVIGPSISPEIKSQSGNTDKFQLQNDPPSFTAANKNVTTNIQSLYYFISTLDDPFFNEVEVRKI